MYRSPRSPKKEFICFMIILVVMILQHPGWGEFSKILVCFFLMLVSPEVTHRRMSCFIEVGVVAICSHQLRRPFPGFKRGPGWGPGPKTRAHFTVGQISVRRDQLSLGTGFVSGWMIFSFSNFPPTWKWNIHG